MCQQKNISNFVEKLMASRLQLNIDFYFLKALLADATLLIYFILFRSEGKTSRGCRAGI
jgi:hypothetical protein